MAQISFPEYVGGRTFIQRVWRGGSLWHSKLIQKKVYVMGDLKGPYVTWNSSLAVQYILFHIYRLITVADLHSKILDAPPPPRGSKFFQFHAVFGEIWQNRMLAPPLESWRPLLGEILDPPLDKDKKENAPVTYPYLSVWTEYTWSHACCFHPLRGNILQNSAKRLVAPEADLFRAHGPLDPLTRTSYISNKLTISIKRSKGLHGVFHCASHVH